MKTTSSLKQGIAKIRRAWLAKKFTQAFQEADRLLQEWPDNAHLLVLWADLIQLQETEEGPTIEDAKVAYRRAADLDPDSPEPLVGLGHYLTSLDDDAKGASKCFARALTLSRDWLRETLLAQAEVLNELGRRQEAFDCLMEARWLQTRNGNPTNGKHETDIVERLEALQGAE